MECTREWVGPGRNRSGAGFRQARHGNKAEDAGVNPPFPDCAKPVPLNLNRVQSEMRTFE